MSHKKNASANRDALFGSAGGGGNRGPKHKANAAANRDALFSGAGGRGEGSSSKKPSGGMGPSGSTAVKSSRGYSYGGLKEKRDKNKKKAAMLSPEAREKKMAEAEDYKKKAKKAMQSGLFKSPDPGKSIREGQTCLVISSIPPKKFLQIFSASSFSVMASTFYKRAADAYQTCGEDRLERLYRVSSADCQMKVNAFATAAAEYTRAADLLMLSEDVEDTLEQKRRDGCH